MRPEIFIYFFTSIVTSVACALVIISVMRTRSTYKKRHIRLLENYELSRRQLSREIHDTVGSYVTPLKIALSNGELFSADDRLSFWEKKLNDFERVFIDVNQSLYPIELQIGNIKEAIEALCYNLSTKECTVTTGGIALEEIKEKPGIQLFRIIQETIVNILKHTNSTIICVSIWEHEHSIVAAVSFNGDNTPRSKLNGLLSGRGQFIIKERMKAIDAKLSSVSEDGLHAIRYKVPLSAIR